MSSRAAFLALLAAAVLASAAAHGVETGPRWNDLSAGQRAALGPLEREWPSIAADRKQKWLQIAERFPSMAPPEQARIQARMSEWARMTPDERGRARLAYQEAKRVPPADRQSRWEAYQALPNEQKREFAARATPPASDVRRPPPPRLAAPQAKSNIVQNPALAAPPPKPVAPTVVQGAPGATTNLMSRRPVPPAHQQTGLPKIAATPEFVDRSTLLPQRGPQGAAVVRPVPAASAPGSSKR